MDTPYKVVYFRSEFASSKQVVLQADFGQHHTEKYAYCCRKQICMLEGKEYPHDWAATQWSHKELETPLTRQISWSCVSGHGL